MYSINEIIDIAIGLEEAGYDFYTKCADKFNNNQLIKDLFTFLADEELAHKESFKLLRSESDNVKGDFTEEYYLYMKSIGGGKIFADSKEVDINNITTPEEAIKKAFHDEKEAILFYSELKQYYKDDSKTIALLDDIISEERNHVSKLYNTMKYLEK